MSDKENTNYIGQYISSINNAVLAAVELYNKGLYFEAAHRLGVLMLWIQLPKEMRPKLLELSNSLLNIPRDARQYITGSTDTSRELSYEQVRNELAFNRFRHCLWELNGMLYEAGYFLFDSSGRLIATAGDRKSGGGKHSPMPSVMSSRIEEPES